MLFSWEFSAHTWRSWSITLRSSVALGSIWLKRWDLVFCTFSLLWIQQASGVDFQDQPSDIHFLNVSSNINVVISNNLHWSFTTQTTPLALHGPYSQSEVIPPSSKGSKVGIQRVLKGLPNSSSSSSFTLSLGWTSFKEKSYKNVKEAWNAPF